MDCVLRQGAGGVGNHPRVSRGLWQKECSYADAISGAAVYVD